MTSTSQQRPSSESPHQTQEGRHSTTLSRPVSIAPTDTASILTAVEDVEGGEATPRAISLAPTLVETRTRYRGFASEAAYRAAFREWAESKRYIQQEDTPLIGFYGETTMEELAARPRVEFGLSRKWRERRERKKGVVKEGKGEDKEERGRRGTVA